VQFPPVPRQPRSDAPPLFVRNLRSRSSPGIFDRRPPHVMLRGSEGDSHLTPPVLFPCFPDSPFPLEGACLEAVGIPSYQRGLRMARIGPVRPVTALDTPSSCWYFAYGRCRESFGGSAHPCGVSPC
jgi:hypothetical protein